MDLKKIILTSALSMGFLPLASIYVTACEQMQPERLYKPFTPRTAVAIPSFSLTRDVLQGKLPIVLSDENPYSTLEVDLSASFFEVESASLELIFTDDLIDWRSGSDPEFLQISNIQGDCQLLSIPLQPNTENSSISGYIIVDDIFSKDITDGKLSLILSIAGGSVQISQANLTVTGRSASAEDYFKYHAVVSVEGVSLDDITSNVYVTPLIPVTKNAFEAVELSVTSFIENQGPRPELFEHWGVLRLEQESSDDPPLYFPGQGFSQVELIKQESEEMDSTITIGADYPKGVYAYHHYVRHVNSGEVKIYKVLLAVN